MTLNDEGIVRTAPRVPFLKWAGGKRWLTDCHSNLFPANFNRLIEPFLGSGAVFFRLSPPSAILGDANADLIATYAAIRDEPTRVIQHLRRHHRFHSKAYYYSVRDSAPRSSAGRAAKLIYLNRTCWNGLYRVNLKGEFNVPIGTKSSVLLETDDFCGIATLLRRVTLVAGDFEATMQKATRGDFLFIDPPYTVKHNTNGFVKYNEGLFSWDDQIRLRDAVVSAARLGAKVLITNAYHDSVLSLYRNVGEIICLARKSVISGKAYGRGRYEEMVVKCY
jgi:DNA adenine methylase